MKQLIKRIALRMLELILCVAIAIVLAVAILEWFAGCGETYIDSKGKRHAHECLFIGR
jgi:hypothetical protein